MTGFLNYGAAAGPLSWRACSSVVWPCLVVFETRQAMAVPSHRWPVFCCSVVLGAPRARPTCTSQQHTQQQLMNAYSATSETHCATDQRLHPLMLDGILEAPCTPAGMPALGSTRSQRPQPGRAATGGQPARCALSQPAGLPPDGQPGIKPSGALETMTVNHSVNHRTLCAARLSSGSTSEQDSDRTARQQHNSPSGLVPLLPCSQGPAAGMLQHCHLNGAYNWNTGGSQLAPAHLKPAAVGCTHA